MQSLYTVLSQADWYVVFWPGIVVITAMGSRNKVRPGRTR